MIQTTFNLASYVLPAQLAGAVGLRYVSDEEPGITRRRQGRGFVYLDHRNRPVSDPSFLRRLEELVIPPAWRQVWICRTSRGHLQVTGRDDRLRKQYIYHPRWLEAANQQKFARLQAWGIALPEIRQHCELQLRRVRRLDRQKVLSLALYLLDVTAIRVGNSEYARDNGSFGLTTLQSDHVRVRGSEVEMCFPAKSGKECALRFRDPRTARLLKRCLEANAAAAGAAGANPESPDAGPLLRYFDEQGRLVPLTSQDVNDFLQEFTGQYFTAKDFRTWRATVLAADLLRTAQAEIGTTTERQRKRTLSSVVRQTAAVLNNTPAVCRKYYIHPAVAQSYQDGEYGAVCASFRPREVIGLTPAEVFCLHALKKLSQPKRRNRKHAA